MNQRRLASTCVRSGNGWPEGILNSQRPKSMGRWKRAARMLARRARTVRLTTAGAP